MKNKIGKWALQAGAAAALEYLKEHPEVIEEAKNRALGLKSQAEEKLGISPLELPEAPEEDDSHLTWIVAGAAIGVAVFLLSKRLKD